MGRSFPSSFQLSGDIGPSPFLTCSRCCTWACPKVSAALCFVSLFASLFPHVPATCSVYLGDRSAETMYLATLLPLPVTGTDTGLSYLINNLGQHWNLGSPALEAETVNFSSLSPMVSVETVSVQFYLRSFLSASRAGDTAITLSFSPRESPSHFPPSSQTSDLDTKVDTLPCAWHR